MKALSAACALACLVLLAYGWPPEDGSPEPVIPAERLWYGPREPVAGVYGPPTPCPVPRDTGRLYLTADEPNAANDVMAGYCGYEDCGFASAIGGFRMCFERENEDAKKAD